MNDSPAPPHNAFEANQPQTAARTAAEGRIEQLRLEGGLFVEAVRATRMPMAVTDPSLPGNPIVFANGAFLNLSGYSMDEVLGQQPHFMNGAGTDPADAAVFREALEQDRDALVETVQYRKDGSRFLASVLLSAFKDEEGRTLHQFLSYLDVTARETAEAALAASLLREAATSDSEAQLRLLVGTQTMWETDPEGLVVADSPSWRTYTGQTLEQWLGNGWLDAVHPEDRAYAERQWREAIAERKLVNAEFRLRAPHGGWRWTNVRAVPVLDAEGNLAKWAGTNIDIDARKRAEAALRESEERFRALTETIEDVFYMTDLERGALEYLSPSYERVWGRSVDELLADLPGFLETVHPDDRALVATSKALQERGEPVSLEYRIVRPDGEERWILDRSFPVAGAHRRSAGVASDVTASKAAEEALRESEEQFRRFGEASQDVIWIRDAETLQWQYLTPVFEAIYGLSREEALQGDNFRSWLDLIVPEDRENAVENFRRVREGEHVAFEYRVRRPSDGAIRHLRDTGFPIADAAGQVKLIGGVGHDLTELRRTEQRLQVLMQGIPQLVWRASPPGVWTWASPQWRNFTGQHEAESAGWGWLDVVHPSDRPAAKAAWSEAEARGVFEVEYRGRHHDSHTHRWFQTRALPVRDETGAGVEWLGTSTDIHELRELQERQQVLVAELQHRTRNLIGVIRSMADKTARTSPNFAEFRLRYRDRLDAMARVQGLLSRLNEHDRVTFDELIRTEIAAMDGGSEKVELNGPGGVRLRSSTVQTLALAIHELATNAVKYGALGQAEGRLAIRWSFEANGAGGKPWLHIDWRESGVAMPQPGSKPQGSGQGRELIERALPYQLGARTTYSLGPHGVHCTIAVPVSETSARLEETDG